MQGSIVVKAEGLRVIMISMLDVRRFYGSTIRPFYLNKALSEMGMEILHFCLQPPHEGMKNTLFVSIPVGKSLVVKLFFGARSCVQAWRFHPDVIYAHQRGPMRRIGRRLHRFLRKPLVYDIHSSVTEELEAYGNISEAGVEERFEKLDLLAADKVIVVSPDLRGFLATRFSVPDERLVLIPNGVNLSMFSQPQTDEQLKTIKGRLQIPNMNRIVAFTCPRRSDPSIDWFQGNDIALKWFFQVVELLESMTRDVTYLILGGGEMFPAPPSVIYAGNVEDLPSTLAVSDVCVLPYPPNAVSGGARNKAYEYFAAKKPVVSTTEGMRGISAVPGRDFLIADSPYDFARTILDVLLDKSLAARVGSNGFQVAKRNDWAELGRTVFDVLSLVAANA
jgi:glycosyltransferase involved in cell wall biosynthesis